MPVDKKLRKIRRSLPLLYFLALVLAVSSALPAYIQSNFLGQLVNLKMVSLFFIIANFFTIVAIIFFPDLIKKFSNYFLTKVVLILYGLSLLCLTLTSSPLAGFLSIILYTVTANLIFINFDILIESFSKNATMGRTRTIYYTFINLGWIGAPLISASLVESGNYSAAFITAAFLVIPIFLIVLSQKKKLNDHINYSREKISTAIKKTWHNKNLRGIFFIALLLSLFFSCVVLYIPLYLHENLGMDWGVLGPIFSFMLLPFLLVEIPAGIIADKYWGEKKMLVGGFIILILSLLLFFFIDQPTVWLWAMVLFLSRFGAALIEAMRETYFFKIVNPGDVGYINVFRITIPLGYVLGSGLALLVLAFFDLPFLFLFLAIIMLSSFFFIASLKDTR